jgi:hypothetical protein
MITELEWNNPEVYFKEVICSEDYKKYYQECQCAVKKSISQKCKTIEGRQGLWYFKDWIFYPCASTTRYYDGFMGACGCGYIEYKESKCYPWQHHLNTAAANGAIYSTYRSWCGMGCGQCFKISPTGYSPEGSGTTKIEPLTIMVTNHCPKADNLKWCTSPNAFGYLYHFDLMDKEREGSVLSSLNWDNPEVYFELIQCPLEYYQNWKSCKCYGKTHSYTGPGHEIYQNLVKKFTNLFSFNNDKLKICHSSFIYYLLYNNIVLAYFLFILK